MSGPSWDEAWLKREIFPRFKRVLANEPHRTMLRVRETTDYSAREVARLFLQELLAAIRRERGEKVSDLTIPAPVGYYEQYRAELQALARSVGVRQFRSLDEPVAAALGYGVNIAREETLLVVDFGGGTLNLAAEEGIEAGEERAPFGGRRDDGGLRLPRAERRQRCEQCPEQADALPDQKRAEQTDEQVRPNFARVPLADTEPRRQRARQPNGRSGHQRCHVVFLVPQLKECGLANRLGAIGDNQLTARLQFFDRRASPLRRVGYGPPCGEAMGRWQPGGLTEGPWRGAPPLHHRFAAVPLPTASRQGGSYT